MYKVLAFLACLAVASATTVDSCGSGLKPTDVRVEGCDASPCIFTKGETAVIEVDLAPTVDVETLPVWAVASIMGIGIDLPLPDTDACNLLADGVTCPIAADTPVTVRVEIPIEDTIPSITADLEVGVDGPDGSVMYCFAAVVTIQ